MKWLFLSLIMSLASVFTLMALYVTTEDEHFKSYDSLDNAVKDGAVIGTLIPEEINPSASNIQLAFRPDSSNVFISFKYNGNYPLSANEWTYTMKQEVQRIFCKSRKHFNRNLFEGNLNYFELQNNKGRVIYMAIDRSSNIAYLSM